MTIANLGELRGAIEDNLARSDFPVAFSCLRQDFREQVQYDRPNCRDGGCC